MALLQGGGKQVTVKLRTCTLMQQFQASALLQQIALEMSYSSIDYLRVPFGLPIRPYELLYQKHLL